MASKPPKPPDAFLSYTRFDDKHDGGAISELRLRLASTVRAITGEPFEIFQDVDGIGLGEHWPGKLDQMLDQVRFLIPILTPSYFTSKPCREELGKFLRAEAERERNDLVLPIYYRESDVLEDDDLRGADSLASTLHERQRQDWRELRYSSFKTKRVRIALDELAKEIVRARRRPMPPRPASQRRAASTSTGTTVPQPASSPEAQQSKALSRPATASLTPGTVFRDIDAPWCPELVVIPPGEFMMGLGSTDSWWSSREMPQHLVQMVYPLAVGRYPVTFEEYGYFAHTTGRAQPGDEDWGRGRRPVINVDWDDAKFFVAWLSVQTGQSYRLLSEAEWEYACRAGTTTRRWWGDKIRPKNANYGSHVGKTSEVGKYPANPFGLYDMLGNVSEWVEDLDHGNYEGAPSDGSAWTTGDDNWRTWRMLRGGSWRQDADYIRSASRIGNHPGLREDYIGFRVARTLSRSESVTP